MSIFTTVEMPFLFTTGHNIEMKSISLDIQMRLRLQELLIVDRKHFCFDVDKTAYADITHNSNFILTCVENVWYRADS